MARDDGLRGFEALYQLHRAELLRFLVARTGDRGEAEDILQDVWIRLQQASAGPVTNGRAYLYRMAQNLVIDRVRERHRRMQRERSWLEEERDTAVPGADPVDPSQTMEEIMLEREETARLLSALTTLPEGARRVFELHKIEGLPHAEVALRLGISKSGVEKHMAVAVKYLRRALLD